MADYVTKDQVIEWFRPYGHTDEGIPFDVLRDDVQGIPAADVVPVVHSYWESYACSQYMGTDEVDFLKQIKRLCKAQPACQGCPL